MYLDGAQEPLAVLKEPPYRLRLDTKRLPDGEHTLRVVTHFRGGGQEIREIPFTVNNYPDVLVLGVDEGSEVAGEVELRLSVGEPELPVEPQRFNPLWYAVALLVVLGGVWGYFALSPAAEKIVEQVAPPAQETQAQGAAVPAGVDPASWRRAKPSTRRTAPPATSKTARACPRPSPPWRATPT